MGRMVGSDIIPTANDIWYWFVEASATGADRAMVWVAASEAGATLYVNLTSTRIQCTPSTTKQDASTLR